MPEYEHRARLVLAFTGTTGEVHLVELRHERLSCHAHSVVSLSMALVA